MPLPLALLAAPGFGRKAIRGIGKLFGGKRRRRRRRRRAARRAAQTQTSMLMQSVPGTTTALGRGANFLAQQAAPFLGIGSKKRQAEAVDKAQTPEELIKKYWWIIAIVVGYFFLKKNKML